MNNHTYLKTEQLTLNYLVNKSDSNFDALTIHLNRCFKDKLKTDKTLSYDDTQDIIWLSMTKIWKKLETEFTVNQLTHGYYATILINMLCDFKSKRINYANRVPFDALYTEEIQYGQANPFKSYETKQLLEEVFLYLSKKDIDFIILRHIKGYKQAEIAEILNKPLGTIKSQEFELKKKIKEIVGAL
ncbi:MAG: hypothetical protein RLZZ175_2535 [Bacteroidota bacterium]|jgi:RNA polymerase sigma-70 factor (ECF subfamily)